MFRVALCVVTLTTSLAVAQPKFDPPQVVPPDPATRAQIESKQTALRAALAALPRSTPPDVRADVEVYAKAVEWIMRHQEFFQKDSARQTVAVLDAGLARAKAAAAGQTPWRDVRGRPIVRGYYSSVDGSVQPFSVTLPEGYGTPGKQWRLDIVLHGRDQTLTEVKFIAAREAAKPGTPLDYIVLEPYGRGNNAYRWAGETDVKEAARAFVEPPGAGKQPSFVDPLQVVLRGFSMGGAGTWHIGLHHPFVFAVLGPGAGFTTTRGYIRNLPPQLPDYQERCLHIYDAVDYAENAFNIPVVAYSGEKDAQKAAADNIEARLKEFSLPVRFTHLIAPGLEHQMPREWQLKADAEYRKHLAAGRKWPERVRFVTYTTRYHDYGWGHIEALDRHYEKTVIDGHWTKDQLKIQTTNVRAFGIQAEEHPFPAVAHIDGQEVELGGPNKGTRFLAKTDGKWAVTDRATWPGRLIKRHGPLTAVQGPIDDAFLDAFEVVGPSGEGWSPGGTRHAAASLARFRGEWDKYFRGQLPLRDAREVPKHPTANLVLFGDPGSNPLIAEAVKGLPITWTREKLVVNGVEYDPSTHVPVLIYPNPANPLRYIVINSGHTFREADLKGTNALLYPRLGDWAVLKVTPTEKDPAAAEVVAAGLFDEFWQFPRK